MVFFSSQKGAASSAATLILLARNILPVAASCGSYVTVGSTPNQTYSNYAFYDFRNLGDSLSGTPVYSQDENFANGQFSLATSQYFNSSTWTDYWSTMAYTQPANRTLSQYVDTVFTPLNVAIVKDNSTQPDGQTVLSLTTTRLDGYSPSAQIQTIPKFMYASVRMSARMLGPPGACGSFYLFGDNDNESDIEMLTNDTNSVFHATNHPSQDSKGNIIPGASTIAAVPVNGTANGTQAGTWSDWTDWRMDWLHDRTQWIINGDLVVDKTWSPPKIPCYLSVNMWSNGGTWTGNMTVGSTATLQIRWIEMVYNTTSDSPSSGNVCVVADNNDANNIAAISANPVSWASPRISSSKLSWAAIAGVSLWMFL